jgi:hypothetical protein
VAKLGGVRLGINTRDGANQSWSLVPFENLPGQAYILRSIKWEGNPLGNIYPEKFKTRKRKLVQPEFLEGKQFCSLLGWFLSEGYILTKDKGFGISQMKEINKTRIDGSLKGFAYKWNKTGVNVYAAD